MFRLGARHVCKKNITFKSCKMMDSHKISYPLKLYLSTTCSKNLHTIKLTNRSIGNRSSSNITTNQWFANKQPTYASQQPRSWAHTSTIPDYPSDLTNYLKPYVDPNISYAHGRSLRQLSYVTLAPMIENMARENPDRIAIGFQDQELVKTYKELNDDIDRLAAGMLFKLNLKRGEAVGLYSCNCYESLLVYYACNKLGLVLNPFNPNYKWPELNFVLQKSGIKCLFMPGLRSRQESLNDHWAQLCNSELSEKISRGDWKLNLQNVVILDGQVPDQGQQEHSLAIKDVVVGSWNDYVNDEIDSSSEKLLRDMISNVSSDDLYCIYYTSGTTGVPKGASITQFNAINCVNLTSAKLVAQRPGECKPIKPLLCCSLPLFHAYAGILGALLPFVKSGGPVIFTGLKYQISTVVETIQKHECNLLYVTPTILIDLLTYIENNQQDGTKIASLKTIVVGGAKIIPETVNKCRRLLPHLEDFRILYGSSENGVIATIQTRDEFEGTRLQTVGSPLDLTEVRIADPQTNLVKPLGEPGEVQTRGFNTMAGYLGEPERTREAITEARWYKTGDLGRMDLRGSIQIVGRIKELIIKGGENIYPAEVEAILHQHPDIEDAQVFGVPDQRFGEEVAVWIKLKQKLRHSCSQDEEKLRSDLLVFCKARLTYFKLPKYVIFVDDFPMTPVKKIKKFEMRAKTVKMLNLRE